MSSGDVVSQEEACSADIVWYANQPALRIKEAAGLVCEIARKCLVDQVLFRCTSAS